MQKRAGIEMGNVWMFSLSQENEKEAIDWVGNLQKVH